MIHKHWKTRTVQSYNGDWMCMQTHSNAIILCSYKKIRAIENVYRRYRQKLYFQRGRFIVVNTYFEIIIIIDTQKRVSWNWSNWKRHHQYRIYNDVIVYDVSLFLKTFAYGKVSTVEVLFYSTQGDSSYKNNFATYFSIRVSYCKILRDAKLSYS